MVANVHQRIVPVKADFTMNTDRLEALIQVGPAELYTTCSPVCANDVDMIKRLVQATTVGGLGGGPGAVLCHWHDRYHQQRRGRPPDDHRADRCVLKQGMPECPVAF